MIITLFIIVCACIGAFYLVRALQMLRDQRAAKKAAALPQESEETEASEASPPFVTVRSEDMPVMDEDFHLALVELTYKYSPEGVHVAWNDNLNRWQLTVHGVPGKHIYYGATKMEAILKASADLKEAS